MLVNSTSATSDKQEGRKSLFLFYKSTERIDMNTYQVKYEDVLGYTSVSVVYANNIQEAWREASNEAPINTVPVTVEWLLDY